MGKRDGLGFAAEILATLFVVWAVVFFLIGTQIINFGNALQRIAERIAEKE